MRDLLAMQIMVVAVGLYLAAMFALTLLIGGWMFAVLVPTIVPSIVGAAWLADRLVSR